MQMRWKSIKSAWRLVSKIGNTPKQVNTKRVVAGAHFGFIAEWVFEFLTAARTVELGSGRRYNLEILALNVLVLFCDYRFSNIIKYFSW